MKQAAKCVEIELRCEFLNELALLSALFVFTIIYKLCMK